MNVRLVIQICLIEVVTVALHSCDTIETVKLPENPPKLVVNCIAQNTALHNDDLDPEFSSDSLFTAYVSSSGGILQPPSSLPQASGVVNLYENGTFLEALTWSPNFNPWTQGSYKSKKNSPKPGSTYQIEVINPSYATLTASYTQPQPILVDSLELKIIGPDPSDRSFTDLQVRIRFADPADEDYYELALTGKSDNIWPGVYSAVLGLSFVDPAYSKTNGLQMIQSGAIIFSDSFFNGKEAVLDILAMRPGPEIIGDLSLKYYSVRLNHISKEYYLYLKTYLLQKQTEGDPYAQPVMVENNIQNGYGIFCGFTTTTKTVVFDK